MSTTVQAPSLSSVALFRICSLGASLCRAPEAEGYWVAGGPRHRRRGRGRVRSWGWGGVGFISRCYRGWGVHRRLWGGAWDWSRCRVWSGGAEACCEARALQRAAGQPRAWRERPVSEERHCVKHSAGPQLCGTPQPLVQLETGFLSVAALAECLGYVSAIHPFSLPGENTSTGSSSSLHRSPPVAPCSLRLLALLQLIMSPSCLFISFVIFCRCTWRELWSSSFCTAALPLPLAQPAHLTRPRPSSSSSSRAQQAAASCRMRCAVWPPTPGCTRCCRTLYTSWPMRYALRLN